MAKCDSVNLIWGSFISQENKGRFMDVVTKVDFINSDGIRFGNFSLECNGKSMPNVQRTILEWNFISYENKRNCLMSFHLISTYINLLKWSFSYLILVMILGDWHKEIWTLVIAYVPISGELWSNVYVLNEEGQLIYLPFTINFLQWKLWKDRRTWDRRFCWLLIKMVL